MINVAIRYQPILAELRQRHVGSVLEVGSGPEGLALVWRGAVVGADPGFKRRPLHRAVAATTLALPFPTRSWPLVVSCDTLEHLPPPLRPAAVAEMARVADTTLLIAFPSGPAALDCYVELAASLPRPLPGWLREHLTHGLPDAGEVAGWLRAAGWWVETRWYEPARAHLGLMRWETRRPIQFLTYSLMRLAGPWLAPRWPVGQSGPLLRALLVAERRSA